jgi:outer membrane protein
VTGVVAEQESRITAGAINNPILYDRLAGGAAIGQLITDFGRTGNLVESSNLRAQAEEQRAVATAAQITLAVDQAFYRALETRALQEVAQQTLEARQAVADQVRALTESKLKSDLDLSFAEVNLAEAKLLRIDAENSQKSALAVLSAVLGYSSDQAFELIDGATPIEAPSPDLDRLTALAISRRPELAALQLESRALERLHVAEEDLSRPSVRTLGVIGGAPIRNEHLSSWYGAIGFNVEIPVFNGYLFTARAKEADLRAQAAREQLRDLQNTVARDVRTSWLAASTAYGRLAVTRQLLDQASQALDLARTRYTLGLGSIVELTQAQLQATRAQIGDTDSRYQYRLSQAVLRFEVGGF